MDTLGIVGASVGGLAAVINLVKNRNAVLNSMTGSVPRCMLFVKKVDSSVKANTQDSKQSNKDVAALRKLVGKKKSSATTNLLKAAGDLSAQAKAKQIEADNKNKKSSFKEVSKALKEMKYSVMEMQYNPSTLRITGRGSQEITNMVGASDAAMNQVQSIKGNKMTRLSCELIFDQVNVHDSFLMEGLAPTPGNVLSMADNLITNANSKGSGNGTMRKLWGDKYSVQIPVEGLVSLIQFSRTSEVVFFWSDMFFHGEITSVNASYSMFNKLGNPVRAKVQITIEQGNDQIMYQSDEDEWNECFDALFGEAGYSQFGSAGSDSLVKNIMG